MTDVAEIARSLTKAQREAVVRRQGSHSEVTSSAVYDLWFSIIKLGEGQFGISLTRTGLAVRDYLKEQQG